MSENLKTIRTLTREIPREGLTSHTILNAENAIVKTKRKTCDLIVLNTDSLGMNGMDLCRILKKETCTVKKKDTDIVLSAQAYRLLCYLADRPGKSSVVNNSLKMSGTATLQVGVQRWMCISEN